MPDAWNNPLARRLTLVGCRELATLSDGRDVLLTGRLAALTHDVARDHAAELLIEAARSGGVASNRRATEQLGLVLRAHRMLDEPETRARKRRR